MAHVSAAAVPFAILPASEHDPALICALSGRSVGIWHRASSHAVCTPPLGTPKCPALQLLHALCPVVLAYSFAPLHAAHELGFDDVPLK